MSTAEQVLTVARSQLGSREDGNGCQQYGMYYGMNCVAWCAEFQWWIFNHAGAGDLICKSAYTPTFYQWFVGRGQSGMQPRPGAVVFYGWNDGGDAIDHVGIVEAVNSDGSITAIEGNTNSPGMVARQRRTQQFVQGYGYPAYSNAQPIPAQLEEINMAYSVDLPPHLPADPNDYREIVIPLPAQNGATAVRSVWIDIVNTNDPLKLRVSAYQCGNPGTPFARQFLANDATVVSLGCTGGKAAPADAFSLILDYRSKYGASAIIEPMH